ncbi:MAG TPA: carbohydrate kinase family protein, partial [Candidatus Eisenbacteria bacterium]
MTPDLVVAGNLLVDDIVLPGGAAHMAEAGGAALYVSLAARLWGVRVGVASVAGSDYPARALDRLAARGIDLAGVRRPGHPGVRTWLLYEERGRRVVHRLGSPAHADVSPRPDDLPADWLGARAFHLSPMPLVSQRALVAALAPLPGAILSLDPHEPLTPATLAAWAGALERCDLLFVGEDELALDDVDAVPGAALRALARGRLARIAFKRGARGGLVIDARQAMPIEWPALAERVADPTGAGDAFAGGFLAGVLAGAPIETALEQ